MFIVQVFRAQWPELSQTKSVGHGSPALQDLALQRPSTSQICPAAQVADVQLDWQIFAAVLQKQRVGGATSQIMLPPSARHSLSAVHVGIGIVNTQAPQPRNWPGAWHVKTMPPSQRQSDGDQQGSPIEERPPPAPADDPPRPPCPLVPDAPAAPPMPPTPLAPEAPAAPVPVVPAVPAPPVALPPVPAAPAAPPPRPPFPPLPEPDVPLELHAPTQATSINNDTAPAYFTVAIFRSIAAAENTNLGARDHARRASAASTCGT